MERSHRPDGREVPAASIEFPSVADEYKSRVSDLHARRKKNLGMGGAQRIAKQHEKGKLTVRERIDLLFDKGTFVELGLLAEQQQVRGVEPSPDGSPGTAYTPRRADSVPMVKETSSMSLGGARLVKAATGEDVTDHDMGGSQVHCYESGVGDNEVDDDAACIASVRRFLSYLPSNNTEPPPRMPSNDPPDRLVDGLEKIVPSNPRAAYDVKRVIKSVFDEDSGFEVKPAWAKNIVIGFAPAGGHPVAVVA